MRVAQRYIIHFGLWQQNENLRSLLTRGHCWLELITNPWLLVSKGQGNHPFTQEHEDLFFCLQRRTFHIDFQLGWSLVVTETAMGVYDMHSTAMPQSYGAGTAICFKRRRNKIISGLQGNVGTRSYCWVEASWKVLLSLRASLLEDGMPKPTANLRSPKGSV